MSWAGSRDGHPDGDPFDADYADPTRALVVMVAD